MARIFAAPNLMLPWTSSVEDTRRYKRILLILSIPFLIVSLVIPFINVPPPERAQLEELPPQLARVQLEEETLPPPPPPTPKPEPEPEPEEEKPKEEPKEEPKPEPEEQKPKVPEPIKEPEPAQLIEQAQEAAVAEINQFADDLSDLREAFDLSDVNDDELTASTGSAAEIDRSVISSGATTASRGIKNVNVSRNTGGTALSGKKNTKVSSKLAQATGKATRAKAQPARDKAKRSEEEIRKVMDRRRGIFDRIYDRALRDDPTLEGKVAIKFVIEPDGRVSSASIVSSELNSPALERKLLAKARSINFGAQAVLQTTIVYDLYFLPR